MKTLTLCAILLTASCAPAQKPTAPRNPPRLTFDVASIRPSSPAQPGFQSIKVRADGAGYTASYIPVKMMLAYFFRVPARQVLGGPQWMEDDRYDIEARADKRYPVEVLDAMYKDLLIDRFHLSFHIETRQANAYVLTLDKGGSKLTPTTHARNDDMPITFSGLGEMHGIRVPMPYLCWELSQVLQQDERPVVDQTHLTGLFDFNLSYLPQNLSPEVRSNLSQEALDRPSLFEALRQQLGLKLTPQKGPVQYLVIDHIERPAAN